MANGAALIRETLWRDRDFKALPRTAQCLYLQLLSQKDLDCAGVLTLNAEVLVKGCDEMLLENLWHDLKTLDETRFIVVDKDTDEVLIRSYARLVSVKNTKIWIAAKTAAGRIYSPKIRTVLASELRRIGRKDSIELANEITSAGCDIDETPMQHPSDIDARSDIDVTSMPPVISTVPVLISSPVDGWVGRAADAAPTCPKHPDGPKHDEPCRDCKQIREHDEAIQAAEQTIAEQARAARAAAIADCVYCDDRGMRELHDDTLTRCTHNPHTFEVPF